MTVGYSGTAPGMGWRTLAADGKGGVNCLVADVDAAVKTVTMML